MSTSISDFSNSTSYDGLLKKVYLPTMQETAYDDDRFTSLIQSRTDLTPGGGNHIVHWATTQRSEGVGSFGEGASWVNSVPVKGKQMTENVKYLNSRITLNGPLIKAANTGNKSAVNAVSAHFKSNIRAYKNNFDRMIMGDGSGRLALISAINAGTSKMTVTKTSFPLAPFIPEQFLPVGTRFHVATFDAAGIDASGPANTNASDDWTFIVSNHDSRDDSAGTAVLSITDEDGTAYAAGGSHNIAVGDYCYRETAYYTTASAAAHLFAVCRDTNGLYNLVTDGSSNSESSTNYTSHWGLTRTSYSYLQSLMKDFSATLDEDNLTALMMDLQYGRQAQPNLLITTPKAERQYFLSKKDDRRFNNVGPIDFVGGYTRMGIQLGEWQLILTSLASMPSGGLVVMNTDDFAFAENSPMEWVLGDGGNVLVQSHTGDTKTASAVHYVNMICFDSARQAKGYSITED